MTSLKTMLVDDVIIAKNCLRGPIYKRRGGGFGQPVVV